VRTTKDEVRGRVLKTIERIAKAAARGAGAPPPDVRVLPDGANSSPQRL
jgi:hippurate hydrolase